MIYRLARELLFRLDAESAHEFTAGHMERLQEIAFLRQLIAHICAPPPSVARTLLGLTFPSPIGIAAGFDKNARLVPFLAALGFGFIEVGTVTLHPQSGNPKPRIFRFPKQRAIINRLGFNNDGADAVAERLRRWERSVPILVNIGKNRDVPLEEAADAYAECYRRLAPLADAVVLNLSSPNTPGLRDLQRPDQLEHLLDVVQSAKVGPILIKIAPDLDDVQLGEIADICAERADGMICTNTTIDRPFASHEAGGLSGAPLMEPSTNGLAKVRRRVGPSYPLIGVGGIFTAEDVRKKMDAGADLVQVYTGFVYEGPALPSKLAREVHRQPTTDNRQPES